jgi:hypothetical protein
MSLEEIQKRVDERTLTQPAQDISPFMDRILQTYGRKVLGIFMYGSMLSEVTKTSTSFPDFFVVTDGYRRVFKKASHWAWAPFLPPHIFHLHLDPQRQCKYNLVSLRRFRRETSARAKDIYILGRFGKRVSLVFARDEQARRALLDCCFSAMCNVVPWTLRGMQGSFDEVEFTLACLNLSYAGETRVEATSKVPKLFSSEKDFYLQVYPRLLKDHAERHGWVKQDDGKWQVVQRGLGLWLRRKRLGWFLKTSRIRGILRWPKFLVTVEGWVDIILAKIERTKGIKLAVTPRQRRHPLIFGWPHLFRLIKAGAIGSPKNPPDKKAVEKKPDIPAGS